jgi:hypothetical protein
MRACPKCGEAMGVAQSITVGGLENKDIAWQCDRDGITAELRHPVQYVHIKVGDVDEVDGRRRRLVHKEIRGAELVVYHEWLALGPPNGSSPLAARPARAGKRPRRRTPAPPATAETRRRATKKTPPAKPSGAGRGSAPRRRPRRRRTR